MAQEYNLNSKNNNVSLNRFRNSFSNNNNDDDINEKLGRLEQAGLVPSKKSKLTLIYIAQPIYYMTSFANTT